MATVFGLNIGGVIMVINKTALRLSCDKKVVSLRDLTAKSSITSMLAGFRNPVRDDGKSRSDKRVILIIMLFYCSNSIAVAFNLVKDPWAFSALRMQYKNMVGQLNVLKKQAGDVGKQLKNMDRQVAKLTNSKYDWRGLQNDINNLGDIIAQAQGIAYSARGLDQVFSENFPGYQSQQGYLKQYESISNAAQNTLNGVLQSASQSAEYFKDTEKRLNDLKKASESAVGVTSAIQAASQIAIEQIEQLQLLRQMIIAQINAQTVYYATRIQKEASAKAELDAVVAKGKEQKVTGVLNNHPIEEVSSCHGLAVSR
jgi:type IV secretion system protein TrbJ